MESELKACPFCGKSVAVIWEGEQVDSEGIRSPEYSVQCHGGAGGCQAEIHGDTEAEAIAAWSTRTPCEPPAPVGDTQMESCMSGWEVEPKRGCGKTWETADAK